MGTVVSQEVRGQEIFSETSMQEQRL